MITKEPYYTNKHGWELGDYLQAKDRLAYYHFCIMNAVKYRVRMGKKAGNSKTQDYRKSMDYIARASYCYVNGNYDDIERLVNRKVAAFAKYTR